MNNDNDCINNIEDTGTVLVLVHFSSVWLIVTTLFRDVQKPDIKSKQDMECLFHSKETKVLFWEILDRIMNFFFPYGS